MISTHYLQISTHYLQISTHYLLISTPYLQIQEADKCGVYDTVVFEGPPKTEQTLWPRHCVQESWGAEIHKDLKASIQISRFGIGYISKCLVLLRV